MCNLCNDSKFTLRHKQVTGLVVLAQHHIGVTSNPAISSSVLTDPRTSTWVNLRLIRLKIDQWVFVSPVASKDRTIPKYACTI